MRPGIECRRFRKLAEQCPLGIVLHRRHGNLHDGKNTGGNLRTLDYLARVQMLGEQLDDAPSFNQVTVPDLWQQQAVTALRCEPANPDRGNRRR